MSMRPTFIGIVSLALAAFGSATRAQQPQPRPSPCAAAEFHQFDFWIGAWDVTSPDGKPAGRNHVVSFANGCGIAEEWTGAAGGNGRSLNNYDPADKKWHQYWVGAGGRILQLAGSFANGVMTLENASSRIRWTHNADGTVRQVWDVSRDGGKTWQTTFDGKYAKAKVSP